MEWNRDESDVMANETTYVNHAVTESNETAVGEASVNGAAAEHASAPAHHLDDAEVREWLESLDSVLDASGPEVATEILERLRGRGAGRHRIAGLLVRLRGVRDRDRS